MGTNSISTKKDGDLIKHTDPNEYKTALSEDLIPRNSGGVPSANAGDLGSSIVPFKKATVIVAYLEIGMLIPFHSYGGALTPGQGWFKCDGSIINEANYNTLHGAGSWATYIGSSDLNGLYSPNFNDKYALGVADTTKDGSVAITSVGNANHQRAIATHNHTAPSHSHNFSYSFYNDVGGGGFQGVRTITSPTSGASQSTMGSGGSHTVDVQPDSIEIEFWIRIVS